MGSKTEAAVRRNRKRFNNKSLATAMGDHGLEIRAMGFKVKDTWAMIRGLDFTVVSFPEKRGLFT